MDPDPPLTSKGHARKVADARAALNLTFILASLPSCPVLGSWVPSVICNGAL